MKTLVIVSCGARKIWKNDPTVGPTAAKDVYTGPFFKKNRAYAERFADRWVILSAKYGFVDPDFIMPEDYNVSFKRKTSGPVSSSTLKDQVNELGLDEYQMTVILGGRDYIAATTAAFSHVDSEILAPLEGLTIGKAMSKVNTLMERGELY